MCQMIHSLQILHIDFILILSVTLKIHQNSNLTGGMPNEICDLYESWLSGDGYLENIIGDCIIGTCDALGIGVEVNNFPCPCTCCVQGVTPCCYSRSFSNCSLTSI